MKVIEGKFGQAAAEAAQVEIDRGLVATLRALADKVERGEVRDFVGAWVDNDEYRTDRAASLEKGLVLATLLHRRIIDGFLV